MGDTKTNNVTRAQVIEAARSYRNTPFKNGGRSRTGMDCVGLPIAIAADLQVEGWQILVNDIESNAYPKIRRPGFLKGKLDGYVDQGILRRFDREKVQPGDLVLRWIGFGRDHHVSILTSEVTMIEASNEPEARWPQGRVLLRIIDGRHYRSFVRGYQFAEVK